MIDKNSSEDYIVITGGLSGIGLETLKLILNNNPVSKIIITSREYDSGYKKFKQLFPESNNIKLLELDLSKDKSVSNFLNEIKLTCKKVTALIFIISLFLKLVYFLLIIFSHALNLTILILFIISFNYSNLSVTNFNFFCS